MKSIHILIIVVIIAILGFCIFKFINYNKNKSELYIAPTQAYINLPLIPLSSPQPAPQPAPQPVSQPVSQNVPQNVSQEQFNYTDEKSNGFLDSYFENIGNGSNQSFDSPSDSLMMAQNAARGYGDINGLVGEMDVIFHNQAETKGMNL